MKNIKQSAISILLIASGVLLFIMSLKELIRINCAKTKEYQINVTKDSITVFNGKDSVGTVKLEGQLDSLITKDNQ